MRRAFTGKNLKIHFLLTVAVTISAMWLSTGTMAPYAASVEKPFITADCHYPVNIDHPQFFATYLMLDGAPPRYYLGSVVLRRILYPLIAYPFMKACGFFMGGLATNLLLLLVTLFGLTAYVRKKFGERGAIAAAWLFATYPGSYYWAGLPYSYAILVPCTVFCMILLNELNAARSAKTACLLLGGMGVLFLGYDLLFFFGPASVLMMARKKKWKWIGPGILALLLPSIIATIYLQIAYGVPLRNGNTEIYGQIISSYLHPTFGKEWLRLILLSPWELFKIYFFSNFYFLPLLFLLAFGARWRSGMRLQLPEACLLLTALGLFLFNNWAPPYSGQWQMRGSWISRIYQPIFVVFIFYLARAVQELGSSRKWKLRVYGVLALGVALNASLSYGPVLSNPLASWGQYNFYSHSKPDTLTKNVHAWGKRPYGVCD